jgi:hypothetical protein
MDNTSKSETSIDVRGTIEQSIEQLKTVIHGHLELLERSMPTPLIGGPELNHKVVSYAEQNVASAFAFTRKLLEVNNPQDLFMLQTDFVRAQMQAMMEQAKDLTATATMSIISSARIPTAPSS